MLASSSVSLRRSSAVSCAACAKIAAASTSTSTSIRFSPPPAAASSSRSISARRYNASFAQAGDSILKEEDEHKEEEDDALSAEPRQSSTTRRIPRDERFQDWTQTEGPLDDLFKAIGSTSPSPSTPPSPSPIVPPSVASPSPVYSPVQEREPESEAPPTPASSRIPTLEELISTPIDSSSSGPTTQDLERLSPRRFEIPSSTSPDSHRLIYRKTWDTTSSKLTKAFSKRQLFELLSLPPTSGGLGLDVYDGTISNKLRMGTKGKKAKWWKSKRLDQMSKRELIQTILVGHWGMVDPDTVPSLNRGGTTVTESVPLTDRTLFLLLSPNFPVLPKITSHFGIKISFTRNDVSNPQILSLVLTGSKEGVSLARQELDSIEEVVTKREVELPGGNPAKSLRPEVYQQISKLAKTFLEPGTKPNTLIASATEPKSLLRLSRLLSVTFSNASIQASTPLFTSLPSSLPHVEYEFVPYEPLGGGGAEEVPNGLQSLAGNAVGYVRWQSTTTTPASAEGEGGIGEWSEKMRLETSQRLPILLPERQGGGGATTTNKTTSIFQALFEPFKSNEKEEDKYELRAELGHSVFPLYREAGTERGTLGPVRGQGSWQSWIRDWFQEARRGKNETVWIPRPPNRLLESTGVLEPLPSTTSSPFSSLFSQEVDSEEPLIEQRQKESLDRFPSFESTSFRRLIYHPSPSPSSSSLSPSHRLEITLRTERNPFSSFHDSSSSASSRTNTTVSARLIAESKVDVLNPTGSLDLRLKLRRTQRVGEEELELDQEKSTFKLFDNLSLFETLASNPSQSPYELVLSTNNRNDPSTPPTPYFLHTSGLVRQTTITPPRQEEEEKEKGGGGWTIVRESFQQFLPEPEPPTVRRTSYEYMLTGGQQVTSEVIRNGGVVIGGGGGREDDEEKENEGKTRRIPGWRQVLQALEHKCK